MNITLYQICYTQEQLQNVPIGCVPYDNTLNKNSELREFPIFVDEFNRRRPTASTDDYWGFISPKFHEKANIFPETFGDWIKEQGNNAACYFINPCPIMEILFDNVVAHGEYWHPGITNLMQTAINESPGYTYNFQRSHMNNQTFAMCNYFVANIDFWEPYIRFVQSFIDACKANPSLNKQMFYGDANYNRDKTLPFYSFVVERLFSTFLEIYNFIPVNNYAYKYHEQKHKMTPEQFAEMQAISNVKRANLLSDYKLFRYNFNLRNPELFSKE